MQSDRVAGLQAEAVERARVEETLLEVQFELPSRRDVLKCVVTRETIENGVPPTLVTAAAEEDDSGDDAEAAA